MTPALLLVDVIRAFFDEDGIHHYAGVRRRRGADRGGCCERARERDRLVVHAVERHRPGLADFEQPKLPEHCLIGGRDAEFWPGFEPVQRAREIVVPKRRYSAFFATDLALLLREQGVDTGGGGGREDQRLHPRDLPGRVRARLPRSCCRPRRPAPTARTWRAASLEDVQRYLGETPSVEEVLAWL